MAAPEYGNVGEQLVDRRRKLERAISSTRDATDLSHLLQEVDSALERIDAGTYGLCEACKEPIEEERLVLDPLIRNCLDHLSPEERSALEQDLDLASRIQGALLPERQVKLGGWEISYHYEAAGPVSGDYCDLITSEEKGGDFYFLLGDVSGKGVAASMLMTGLRAIVRSLMGSRTPVNRLVERANRLFCESSLPSHFATLVCGRASSTGELEVCNAGHCPPLLLQGGNATRIKASGLPLGLFCSVQYAVKKARAATGDMLVLYSDGLTEARNRASAEYGADRLLKLLRDRHTLAPRALVEACLADLSAFRSGAPKSDDLSLMAIKRIGKE